MIIDSHLHVEYCGLDDHAVVAEMDELGIDIACLLTWYIPPAEHLGGGLTTLSPLHSRPDGTHAVIPLSSLLRARDRYPGRFVAGYCPCPAEGDAPALFEAAYHMHGVRVCGEWSYRMLLDDPRAIELFRMAGRLGCPVVLHMDVPYLVNEEGRRVYQEYWYGGTVLNLERALQACPETIIIGHSPGFWREISGDADSDPAQYPKGPLLPGGRLHRMFDEYPNLWADLSAGSGLGALKRDPQHAREFIIRLADRLLFGRDQFGFDLYHFLQSLDLPEAVLSKILHENAQRLVPVSV